MHNPLKQKHKVEHSIILPLISVSLSLLIFGCAVPGGRPYSGILNSISPRDVIGTYQNPTFPNLTLVFLGNGTVESHSFGMRETASGTHGKWRIYGNEIHFTPTASSNATTEEKNSIKFLNISMIYNTVPSGLKCIGMIIGEKRTKLNPSSQKTFVKIR
ncbi:MAG: hypothetical protein H8E27_13425 [Verrucomicrobia subdivision 3 bacterium]|nr:hypothetical protein [Limisphaerales bacterium]